MTEEHGAKHYQVKIRGKDFTLRLEAGLWFHRGDFGDHTRWVRADQKFCQELYEQGAMEEHNDKT